MPQLARSRRKAPPRRQTRGVRTREAILRRAVNLASVEGLEGLTVGRLAEDLKMSKSGLFAHFGSKEGLQLATVEAARQMFIDQITLPALKARIRNNDSRNIGSGDRRSTWVNMKSIATPPTRAPMTSGLSHPIVRPP